MKYGKPLLAGILVVLACLYLAAERFLTLTTRSSHTSIGLERRLNVEEATEMARKLKVLYSVNCTKRDEEDARCIRWWVEGGDEKSATITFMKRQGIEWIVVRSLPEFYLFLGPQYFSEIHEDIIKLVTSTHPELIIRVEN